MVFAVKLLENNLEHEIPSIIAVSLDFPTKLEDFLFKIRDKYKVIIAIINRF